MLKKILVIDDEQIYRTMLRQYLEDKFVVYDVPDGKEADIVLNSVDDIDLVITDLMMPGEHGVEIMTRIRKEYKIPVLVISGVYDEELFAEDNINFPDGFLKKPFELDKLRKKIFSLIGM